jgi:hypothetical protein
LSSPNNEPVLHTREELAQLLSQNLGVEKATELVVRAAGELAITGSMSNEQCLAVLEQIAQVPGLVGITARFAKGRMILLWGGLGPR